MWKIRSRLTEPLVLLSVGAVLLTACTEGTGNTPVTQAPPTTSAAGLPQQTAGQFSGCDATGKVCVSGVKIKMPGGMHNLTAYMIVTPEGAKYLAQYDNTLGRDVIVAMAPALMNGVMGLALQANQQPCSGCGTTINVAAAANSGSSSTSTSNSTGTVTVGGQPCTYCNTSGVGGM